MSKGGKGGSTAETVAKIALPIAESLGLKIWDISFLKEGSSWYLRIIIDKDGGVNINDCENFSRMIDGPLDEADPIEQSYCLEVSSPGLERELKKPAHFLSCIGQRVNVKTIRPIDGERDFSGMLESYDNGDICVRLDDGSGFCFKKKEAAYIKLDDFNE
ncbi:MAG: ribosome maturation factor RimP [Clostridiales bacterium]|nr:ribosome maturation factor RimP [Clostridiales bacterium]